jgi:hypothetical protein
MAGAVEQRESGLPGARTSLVPSLPGFVPMTYQLRSKSKNAKPRSAYFNMTLIPDPTSWLQEKLGKAMVATL